MKTGIMIVSGFLGAGKTTLIEKLLKESFHGKKVALIENDFGEIGVDAALLGAGGIEVREINSGCICCTLTGDFVRALNDLIDRFHPEEIIIEPSGVGKLSDVIAACEHERVQRFAEIRDSVTVVDVKRCKMYLENFGEFFADQVEHADIVVLSRVEEHPDKVRAAREVVEELNHHAAIVAWPLSAVTGDEILNARREESGVQAHTHDEHGRCGCGCHHEGHDHAHHDHGECGCHHDHDHCGHGHAADEVFDTVTVRVDRAFSESELRARMSEAEKTGGVILRAKGLVPGASGPMNVQYLPGTLEISACAVSGNTLCFIGQQLDHQALTRLFT